MTLIAAYTNKGIPFLIGDVTLTKKGGIRSLRKKVYVISDNFAVGWTGHMFVAKKVIAALKNEFADNVVTKASMQDFFESYEPHEFGSLQTNFIGWVVDDEPHCFRWNCLYPKEVFYDSQFVDGSGQKYFERLKNRAWQSGPSMLPIEDDAFLSVINDVAHARFEESLYRGTWDRSFGVSYDILGFTEGRFGYVRSIAYIGWDYFWDSHKGTGRLEQAPVIVKYNCMGSYSIIQEALHGKHYDGKTINHLSRPVYDDMPQANLSNFLLTLDSDYYANYFLFRENGKTVFKILLTVQNITAEGPLRIKTHGGAYLLDYDTDELDRMYQEYTAQRAYAADRR
jgi:hypothetical protein